MKILPIEEFPGYFVSDEGTVYSCAYHYKMRPLKPSLTVKTDTVSYKVVGLFKNKVKTTKTVHGLVANAFHGPRPGSHYMVRHLDGNCHNNCAVNLAWGTIEENQADKRLHGTQPKRSLHRMAVLSEEDVANIRIDRDGGATYKALGAKYGVGETTIGRIIRGETWSDEGNARYRKKASSLNDEQSSERVA